MDYHIVRFSWRKAICQNCGFDEMYYIKGMAVSRLKKLEEAVKGSCIPSAFDICGPRAAAVGMKRWRI